MKSLKKYGNEQNHYFTSLQSRIENEPALTFESLVSTHGSSIDSVLHKMRLHNYRLANPNYIHESVQDVRFDISEQLAARDIILTVCEQYEYTLLREFCEENGIDVQIDEAFGSVKSFIGKVKNSINNSSEEIKKGFAKVSEKISAVKEFVQKVVKGAIKTAKELAQKLTEMMISLGISFGELLQKFGGSDEDFDTFKEKVAEALKTEKTAKENIYETLANHINSNNGRIDEGFFDMFKRKKKADNKSDDSESEEKTNKDKNEYDDARNAKTTSGKPSFIAKAGKFLKDFLIQIFAYYAVTVFLPAIITLIAGPLAGAIAEVLAKALWSSRTIYSQVTGMWKLVKSPEYKKYPTWLKLVRWALFFLSMWFACSALKTALGDGFEIAKKIFEGAAGQVLPSDMVQKITGILNDFVKKITGENAAGYDKMVEAQNACFEKIEKIATEEQKASDKGKEEFDNNNNEGNFKGSETNNFDHTEKVAGKELRDATEKLAGEKLGGSTKVLHAAEQITVDTPGVTAFGVDGATLGKIGRTEYIERIADKLGVNPSDIDISQVTNNALRDATNGRAGTFFQVIIKGDATQEMADKVANAVNDVAASAGTHGWFHMFSNIPDNLGFVDKITKIPLDVWTNTFTPFAGVGNIDISWANKDGGFKLRLGSRKTQNHYIYDIDEGCVEKIPYNKFVEQYKDRNPKVFSKMEAYINKNVKALEEAIDKMEDKSKLSKDDKKKIELITKHIEDVKEGKSEYDVLVFFTYDKFAESVEVKKNESTNESLQIDEAKVEKGDTKYPVMFINPLILACGDLARQRNTKGPRANLYYIKGLYSRIEFLPMDGGIHISELVEKIIEVAEYGFNTAMKLAIDIPAFNKGSKRSPKWEVNKDSEHGDKARKDFGGFTNAEIAEILNDPDKLSDYMGGRHATDELSGGKHLFTDQKSDEELKEHHDKVVKIYKSFIEEDKSIKEYIENSKTLKSYLFDEDGNINAENFEKISDLLIRIELNYKPKKKKSLWQRAKDWFKSDVENDAKDELNTNEIINLGYQLASKYKKYMKKRIKENLEDDNIFTDLTFLEANLDVFERFYLNN